MLEQQWQVELTIHATAWVNAPPDWNGDGVISVVADAENVNASFEPRVTVEVGRIEFDEVEEVQNDDKR